MHYKHPLFIIILFLSLTSAKANVYVALNPIECSSCIKAFEYVKTLDKKIPKYLVLQQRYHQDSAQLIESFYLKEYDGLQILWSDSLYNKYIGQGGVSSITYTTSDNRHGLKSTLRQLTLPLINIINNISRATDTVQLSQMSNMDNAEIYANNNSILLANPISCEAVVVDIFSGNIDYTISISDSLIKQSYAKALGDTAYAYNMKYLKEWQVPKIKTIYNFWQKGDSTFLVMAYKEIEPYNGKKVVGSFQVLNIYNKGQLLEVLPIPFMIKDNNDSFYPMPRIFEHNNQYYVGILKQHSTTINKKYLSIFDIKKHQFLLNHYYPRTLPNVYKNYNYSNALYSNGYYMLSLSDTVYSVDSDTTFSLGFFPKDNSADLFNPPYYWIADFKKTNDFVWLLYFKPLDNSYYFMKYDIHHKKELFNNKVVNDGFDPVIFDFDYNKIVYKTKDNNIVINNYLNN